MSVINRTRGTVLAETLLTLGRHFRETLHHLNGKGLPPGCALWIAPCEAIYTVGMSRPVDVLFLDREGRIVRLLRNFPPNCFTEPIPEAVCVVELPGDMLRRTGTAVGDIIDLRPV